MSTIGKKIQRRRKELGLTQEELATRMGYKSKSTINKIELGKNDIPQSKIIRFAEALNTTPSYLMGWEDDPNNEARSRFVHSLESYSLASSILAEIRPITKKKLPMLGNVACGEPIFANEVHETFIDANADLDADFCLTAKGDSMINARIFDGDLLFVKSQNTVENGEIAVVLIENEATVKRVYYDKENNVITLVPENPTHKPLRYSGTELDQIRILGKVIAGQYTI